MQIKIVFFTFFTKYTKNGLLSLRCGIVAYIISTLFEDYGNFYINDQHAMPIYYKRLLGASAEQSEILWQIRFIQQ